MGTWLGIEWDDGLRGKHNGVVDGKRYFQTQMPTAGSFIRPGKVGPCATLEDAARERYLNYDSSNVNESLIREAQASLQASSSRSWAWTRSRASRANLSSCLR